MGPMKPRLSLPLLSLGAAATYRLLVSGALTLDTGVGRHTRPLGPIHKDIAAPPEVVFDVIASPYLGKDTTATAETLRVLERGSDMVLAEHVTDIGNGKSATTVETVRFKRPQLIHFRLLRGPVPYVVETFALAPSALGTSFLYTGEMGADFWALGQWWADRVAARWEQAVERSMASVIEEAERLHLSHRSEQVIEPDGSDEPTHPPGRVQQWLHDQALVGSAPVTPSVARSAMDIFGRRRAYPRVARP